MAKDNKKDFLSAFQEVKNIKEMETQPQQLLQEVREKKAIGRPSHKSKDKEYSRIIANIEKPIKDKLLILWKTQYEKEFVSLEDFINHILGEYLKGK